MAGNGRPSVFCPLRFIRLDFSVDGTLVEAWALQKSFRPKDGSDPQGSDFHGQKRKNETHASTTDPDSRLYRKAAGREAKLSYMGQDKAYDTADHVAALREIGATPQVKRNDAETKTGKRRRSAIDARTTRHRGYALSQTRRAMIECIFGWGKQHGTMGKTKHRGIARMAADFLLNLIAYDLVRIPKPVGV
jgi:hypothetical protein